MPPKKSPAAKAKGKQEHDKQADIPERTKQKQDFTKANGDQEPTKAEAETKSNSASKKRKTPPTKASSNLQKTPRQGSRTSSRNANASAQPSTTSKRMLKFLLSKASIPYCFPSDELSFAKSNPKSLSYSLTAPSTFTPFQHLLIASLFSKPLSHALGMRSVRTLLNAPFDLTTPEKIVEAGERRVWEGLEAARTQHRQKTAAYIHAMAERYVDGETMYELAVEANEDGAGGVVSHIKDTVKGMGVTGAEIFCRRIQCVDGWGEAVWPYADGRSIDALRECGVDVRDAEELQAMIEKDVDWDEVGDMGLHEGVEKMDMEILVAVEFVVALERAVGCVLEGRVQELKKAASKG